MKDLKLLELNGNSPTDITKSFWRMCQNSSWINKGPFSNSHVQQSAPLWCFSFLSEHVLQFLKLFPSVFQHSSDFEAHSFPDLPTLTIPPAVAPPLPTPPAATPETSGDQRRAQAFQLGAQILELNALLHSQPSSEKELRALEHNLLLMATILRVPRVNSGVWQPRLPGTYSECCYLLLSPRTTSPCWDAPHRRRRLWV